MMIDPTRSAAPDAALWHDLSLDAASALPTASDEAADPRALLDFDDWRVATPRAVPPPIVAATLPEVAAEVTRYLVA